MILRSQYETASRIVQLGNAITWLRNSKLQPFQLTASQSEAIRYILKQPPEKEITAGDLMAHLQLSQSTVAGIIKRLEEKGLITRKLLQNDNRISLIIPTEEGWKLEKTLRETAIFTEKMLLDGFDEQEQQQLKRMLEKLRKNMEKVRTE